MTFIVEKLNREDPSHRNLIQEDLRNLKIDFYRNYYPNVEYWYEKKFIEGFEDGSRIVHVVRKGSLLYGMSIVRVSPEKQSNKLCTFFLLSEARGNGNGSMLMNRTLQELEVASVAKPILVTIPEERVNERVGGRPFVEFLAEFGFFLEGRESNRYRVGKDEYICAMPISYMKVQIPFLKMFPGVPLTAGTPTTYVFERWGS